MYFCSHTLSLRHAEILIDTQKGNLKTTNKQDTWHFPVSKRISFLNLYSVYLHVNSRWLSVILTLLPAYWQPSNPLVWLLASAEQLLDY